MRRWGDELSLRHARLRVPSAAPPSEVLRQGIEVVYECRATLLRQEIVRGEAWLRTVVVFAIEGTRATRAYAWFTSEEEVCVILGGGVVVDADTAVAEVSARMRAGGN